jgi:hypothetical protein
MNDASQPEILCDLGSSSFNGKSWYGLVRKHPTSTSFCSVIVLDSSISDNGQSDMDLIREFDHVTSHQLRYEPCRADGFDVIYAESHSFASSAENLRIMIESKGDDNCDEYLFPDFRVVELLGLGDLA